MKPLPCSTGCCDSRISNTTPQTVTSSRNASLSLEFIGFEETIAENPQGQNGIITPIRAKETDECASRCCGSASKLTPDTDDACTEAQIENEKVNTEYQAKNNDFCASDCCSTSVETVPEEARNIDSQLINGSD